MGKFFTQTRDDDGNLVVSRTTAWDERLNQYEMPAPERKIGSPNRQRKALAEEMAHEMMAKFFPVGDFHVYSVGSNMINCRGCKTRNPYKRATCKSCGINLPPQDMSTYHSNVSLHSDYYLPIVKLGRDVTQFKDINRLVNDVKYTPPHGLSRDDILWITFVNVIVTITPIVYMRAKNLAPDTFAIAQWRAYNEKSHKKWAIQLIKFFTPILDQYV